MPWRRTVSVWDERGQNTYLRYLETRPSDGLGDYAWPEDVEELLPPPLGYCRLLRMRFDHSPKPFAQERTVKRYELGDKGAKLGGGDSRRG